MNKSILSKLMITAAFVLFSLITFAQPPDFPGPGQDGDQPTPIGSGLVILLALGAAYGGKKVYDARKKLQE